ncbi:MAG TPA: ABC transporter permease [Luteibaculaceae bacterium]|nr:ABC transporter permease [Luteibaculaceae bacterium]
MRIISRLLRESVLIAYSSLVGNKLRSILSLLSITIGIFAIIFVFTLVDSLEDGVRESVASLGDDVVFVEKWPWTPENEGEDYPWWKYWQRPQPTMKDLRELELRKVNSAAAMCFLSESNRKVTFKSTNLTGVKIQSASAGYPKVKSLNVVEGRMISDTEFKTGRNTAVLGYEIAQSLFGTSECIGRQVRISGFKATVVGVLAKEGSSLIGNSMDEVVIVPVVFARSFSNIDESDSSILVKAKTGVSNDQLIDELTGTIRAIHRIRPKEDNDFSLNRSSLLNSALDGLFAVINLAGLVIGAFSIVVGGFSIANIMFVSVKERTNLIGIQKSLGAKNYFILLQFLFEAIFLCIMGGLIGLILVALISGVVNLVADTSILLSFKNIGIGLGTSIAIGVIAGVVPAITASRLDPVEAIRSN